MSAINFMQTNFTGGRVSPRLFGRVDLDRYDNGAEQIYNFIVHPHGGVTRRSGTMFINEVKNSAHGTRLIRFEFSTTQAYVLEFGNEYLRIYLNGGQLQDMGSPVEVSTPYGEDELDELQWVQSNDTLFIFHPSYTVRKLERTDATTWSMSELEFKDGPYLSVGQKSDGAVQDTITLTSASATGTGITLTASADLFASTDVGRQVRLKVSSNDWGWGTIVSYVSATEVTWDIESTVTSTSASTQWRLGLFSGTTGYPRCGTFHQQRFAVAGCASFPSTVALSITGDITTWRPSDLDDTVADDSGLTYTLDSDTVNAIFWMKSGKRLRMGTSGAEFVLWSGESRTPLTPTNVIADLETPHGSLANVMPALVGKNVMFVGRVGRKLRKMAYIFDDDGYEAQDLSILSEDLTIGKIVEVAYQQNPDEVIWCRLSTGKLIALTYLEEQDVIAWHEHDFGGSYNEGIAQVKSISVIPDANGEYDELWLVIQRTVDGNTVQYIELMDRTFDEDISLADSRMLDSYLEYSGTATSTISGLTHLEGETVRAVAAGVDLGEYTVSSGAITLSTNVTSAYVGLMYESKLQSLKFEGGARAGVAQGRLTRAHEVTVRFNRTLGGKIGYTEDSTLETIFERNASDPMGSPPSLYSGDKVVNFPQGHELGTKVFVKQDQPLPMTVLSMMPNFRVEEELAA